MYLESVDYLIIENFACLNNNNNDFAKKRIMEFGSCLDLKNTNNISITNITISSCYSQSTVCGQKFFYEKDKVNQLKKNYNVN